ncbi:hypothetical protein NEOLEDRAFT_1072217, partial [Neolentinus lepideus HHB14362 ss-1]
FLPPLTFELCLQLGGVMTLLLHYWLVSSGDLFLSFRCLAPIYSLGDIKAFSE